MFTKSFVFLRLSVTNRNFYITDVFFKFFLYTEV